MVTQTRNEEKEAERSCPPIPGLSVCFRAHRVLPCASVATEEHGTTRERGPNPARFHPSDFRLSSRISLSVRSMS